MSDRIVPDRRVGRTNLRLRRALFSLLELNCNTNSEHQSGSAAQKKPPVLHGDGSDFEVHNSDTKTKRLGGHQQLGTQNPEGEPQPENAGVAWVAIGDSCDRSGGFFCVPSMHIATCTVHTTHKRLASRKTSLQLFTSETPQSDTSTLHTSPSSTPNTQTIAGRCGGCPDLQSSLCYIYSGSNNISDRFLEFDCRERVCVRPTLSLSLFSLSL